ncbi:hypothetical protein QYF36_014911 [Acer negundo]|nr:hypothetical protein QYF36_014911 [Acer negundo]
MPRASKKKSSKDASTSGSSVGVRCSGYVLRLENNLGRAILSERNMDLNNLIGSEVPQLVDAMGWCQFVTTAHQINERLVRGFYAAMDCKEFEKGTPVKVRGVDVGFSAQDINRYYGTHNHRDLDTGVPGLSILIRYNLDLAGELRMSFVVGAEKVDNLVLPFPALITYFYEQAGIEPKEGDSIEQMDGPLNSRTFNDISAQRHEAGLLPVATRKRQMRDAAARFTADDDPGAVLAGDRRSDWVDELLQRPAWVDEFSQRQTAMETN